MTAVADEEFTELLVRRCENGYEVIVDRDRTTGLLSTGELIEQVLAILPPTNNRYPMRTPEEWAALSARRRAILTPQQDQQP